MIKKISVLLVLIAITAPVLNSQCPAYRKTNIGFYGAFTNNMHSPDFTLPSLALFNNNDNQAGFALGITGNFPVSKLITISGSVGYNDLSGDLEGMLLQDNTPLLSASLGCLEIAPSVQFHNLLPVDRLYFLAGVELGIPLTKSYDLSNATGALNMKADIPDPTFRMAGAVGAGYIFELSKTIFLTPEISFRIPFTDVSSNDDFKTWNVSQLRFGVSLTFGFSGDEGGKTGPESSLDIGFEDIRYYDRDGKSNTLKKIKVEDTQYKELFPLIPYVFFDENKETPADKTQAPAQGNEAGAFSDASLEPEAVKINMKTIDIIGSRLRSKPNATITITGTHDGKKENANKSISQKRAEYVKKYLVTNYGIAPERINIVSGSMPSKPSTSNVPEGVAENRRIEFSSNDKAILQPIIIKEDVQSLADPNLIEFLPYAKSTDSIVSWKLTITQMDKTLRTLEGTGGIPPLQWIIYPNDLQKKELPIEYELAVRNSAGLTRKESGTIPVDYFSYIRKKEEHMPDRTISKFSLILFDFDKADISESDMSVIQENVLPAIKFNSTVKIFGYTDRIGDSDYNRKLAQRRAETVAKMITDKAPDAKVEFVGVGYMNGLFENETPIGRHLSRTVQIFVETPK